jgi:glycerol uptake facilitator-like aquaporin
VQYDGTRWRPVQGFCRSGTATLVGGTVAVADTNITSTSRIRLTNVATGGTIGVLSVALTATTGFTINSSSGSDTSTVYWEIVNYS